MQIEAGSTGNVRMSNLVHHKERSQITLWNHFSSSLWNNEGVAAKGRLPCLFNLVKPLMEESLALLELLLFVEIASGIYIFFFKICFFSLKKVIVLGMELDCSFSLPKNLCVSNIIF